ncbi:MAG TPA: hypothetical protein PKD64_18130 [Pirellulaceae bacterium]|nr:hypothetical protein [Pirellulaceae bacterium]HMP71035.1 hypothetical protein [Pirellulaceae bacterium]
MPGNFTHKVITLEPYIGFGSFYVSLPGLVGTIKRWLLRETSDVQGAFIQNFVAECKPVIRRISGRSAGSQKKLGLGYFPKAARHWKREASSADMEILQNSIEFQELIQFANSLE